MSVAVATEILMPKLSDSMEEGTILSWLVAPGAVVADGQDLLEVETDKANMTVQADVAGTLLEIVVQENEAAPVGAVIARIGDPDAELGDAEESGSPAAGPVTPISPTVLAATGNGGNPEHAGSSNRVKASPLARRIASERGVDLSALSGSGPAGRVVKRDVEAASSPAGGAPMGEIGVTGPAAENPSPSSSTSPETAKGGSTTIELSRLQTVIARRMAEAKATVPHFQVETEVRMDAAIELRAELKALAGDEPAPSFNDMIVRAAALALRDHPKVNGSYRDGAFELHDRVNVGIAVAAEDALVVPTIVDADRKSLGEIGRDSRRLADRVRTGSVTPPELAGGTFTVSNLGMFGMTAIHPVINPPQAAILGVGRTRSVLRRGEDGEIVDSGLLTMTLSCDHRILYGAEAAQFLDAIRALLEAPLRVAL